MIGKTRMVFAVCAVAALVAVAAMVHLPGAGAAGAQAGSPAAPAFTPQSQPVAAGETEAKKLLVLMDADKSGTVSRKEFMDFMAAEFDRLDVNKDGVLDVKELERSQLEQTHRGGGHR